MPLFMDYHYAPGITLDEAKKAHLEDLAVQEKYSVKYHQFWVNEEAGMVFCLMEGPDKESCAATHRESNGVQACNIIEVDGGMYSAFMTYDQKVDHGLVMQKSGGADTGYRFILTLDIISLTTLTSSIKFEKLKFPEGPKDMANKYIYKYQGRTLQQLQNDSLVSVYMTPESVVRAAIAIRNEFIKHISNDRDFDWNIKFKMGISVGQPVTENEDRLFEKAVQQSSRYCKIADEKEIVVPIQLGKLSELAKKEIEMHSLLVLGEGEQQFLERLFDVVEGNLSDDILTVESLSQKIGMSRPHLYRKIQSLTRLSPVSFLRDLKLSKALYLIKQKQKNISEIAFEVGFNNPSYFTKCFQDKYGVNPSKIAV